MFFIIIIIMGMVTHLFKKITLYRAFDFNRLSS